MKYVRFIIIVLLLSFLASFASAQEQGNEVDCSVDNLKEIMVGFSDTLLDFSERITTEEDGLSVLLAANAVLSSMRTACGGEFTHETHPNGIIGPITFAGTLYQAEFSSPGAGSLNVITIDGDCDIFLTILIDGDGGTETDLWEFGGDCIAMIEVDIADSWSFTISRLQ